jgi:UDP:flavonoid glycosyltransferase YjiC (YdhE family)
MAGSTQSVRHIRLLALGSQGDVAPYVALGLRLQQAGFDISLGTTAEFRPLVESYGGWVQLREAKPSRKAKSRPPLKSASLDSNSGSKEHFYSYCGKRPLN